MYVTIVCMYVCMFVFMFVCMTLQGTKGLKAFETVNMMPQLKKIEAYGIKV